MDESAPGEPSVISVTETSTPSSAAGSSLTSSLQTESNSIAEGYSSPGLTSEAPSATEVVASTTTTESTVTTDDASITAASTILWSWWLV